MAKLDDISVANYTVIADKLVNQYIPYYTELNKNYSDPNSATGKVLNTQLQKIKKVLPLLARAIGRHPLPLTKKEIVKLDEILFDIVETHRQIKVLTESDEKLQSSSKKIADDLNISTQEMSSVKRSRDKGSNSLFSRTSDLGNAITRALGLPSLGKTVGLGAFLPFLSPIIGPFIGPTLLGYEMLRGVSGLVKGTFGLGESLFNRKKMSSGLHLGINKTSNTGLELPTSGFSMPFTESAKPSPGAFRTLSRRQKEESTESLFYFFNKRAYKASWTKDVLNSLKNTKGTKGGNNGLTGFIEEFLESLKVGIIASLATIFGGSGFIKSAALGLGSAFATALTAATAIGGGAAGGFLLKTYVWDKWLEPLLFGEQFKKRLGFWQAQKEGLLAIKDAISYVFNLGKTEKDDTIPKEERIVFDEQGNPVNYEDVRIKRTEENLINQYTIKDKTTLEGIHEEATSNTLEELKKMNVNLELIKENSKYAPSISQPSSEYNFLGDNLDSMLSDFEKSLRWKADK